MGVPDVWVPQIPRTPGCLGTLGLLGPPEVGSPGVGDPWMPGSSVVGGPPDSWVFVGKGPLGHLGHLGPLERVGR